MIMTHSHSHQDKNGRRPSPSLDREGLLKQRVRERILCVRYDMSIEEMDDAVGHLSVVGIVGHHDDGGTVLVELGEQSHHLGPVL